MGETGLLANRASIARLKTSGVLGSALSTLPYTSLHNMTYCVYLCISNEDAT